MPGKQPYEIRFATQQEVAADFAKYVQASKKGPIVVTRGGKPVAVLLGSGSEDELERLLMAHSPKLQSILEAARRRFRAGRGIPHGTFWKVLEAETATAGPTRNRARKNGRTRRQ
jgi:prevent-host-death family protein